MIGDAPVAGFRGEFRGQPVNVSAACQTIGAHRKQ
jgi:hypothetical protein